MGTTLLLPCFVDGCGLFVGDVHYAQGDGEVSGTAIEIGARVTVVTEIRKGMAASMSMPHYEGGAQLKAIEPSSFYATTGIPIKAAGEVPIYETYLDSEEDRLAEQPVGEPDAGGAQRLAGNHRLHGRAEGLHGAAGVCHCQRGR